MPESVWLMRVALYDDYRPTRDVLRVEETERPKHWPCEVRIRIEALPHACTRALGSSVKAMSPAAMAAMATVAAGSF